MGEKLNPYNAINKRPETEAIQQDEQERELETVKHEELAGFGLCASSTQTVMPVRVVGAMRTLALLQQRLHLDRRSHVIMRDAMRALHGRDPEHV